jgi:hypothetical protein
MTFKGVYVPSVSSAIHSFLSKIIACIMLALDQVLRILGHNLPIFGTSTGYRRQSARRSGDHGISTPFLGIFGFWDYVTGMGMSAHGFSHY